MKERVVVVGEYGGVAQWLKHKIEEVWVAGEVELVETYNDALERLNKEKIDVLIFLSDEMLSQAKEIKKKSKDLKVVVFVDREKEVISAETGGPYVEEAHLLKAVIL